MVQDISDQSANWSSQQAALQPPNIGAAAWNVLFANLSTQLGTTWGDFVAILDSDAAYLGRLGADVTDVSQLWSFALQQALGFSPVSTLSSVTDDSVDAPGFAITFSRTYANSIIGRNEVGPLGLGWTLDGGWQDTLSVQSDGTVIVSEPDGLQREFQPDTRGGYFDQTGDYGVLTANADGSFSLRELDGSVTGFNADGTVAYEQDSNGNRVTAGYTNGLLTSLTGSSGQWMDLAYSAAGRIVQVTDSNGRTTSYTYDPTNQLLVGVESYDDMMTTYSYDTGSNPATEYALTSIQFPDMSHQYFTYDDEGHLSGTSLDDGADAITYSSNAPGEISATDASGDTTQTFFNQYGLVAKTIDAVGNPTFNVYDSNYNLIATTDASDRSYVYTYDTDGNVTGVTDPLGNVTSFSYGGPDDELTKLVDANANTTNYQYDASGNLISTTYANGSVQTSSYNPLGEATQSVDQDGIVVQYGYDGAGHVTSETFSDGTQETFTYDAHGNLLTATNATGTTTYTYNSIDELTQVAQPGGLYLDFTYNAAGQRTLTVDQTGYTLEYQYDAVGRLSEITDGTGAMIVTYTYNANGELSLKQMGNGTYMTYTYDADGRIADLINYAPDGTIASQFDYTYDSRGRVTSMDTLQGLWTYGYNDLGELTSWTDPQGETVTYAYDAMGNRTQVTDNGVTTDYATNDMNQYTSVGGATYTYDANGNLIRVTDGNDVTSYTYDAQHQLVGITHGSDTESLAYDALGDLYSTTTDGQTTYNMFDPTGIGDIVGQYDSTGQLIAHYTYGLGLISSVNAVGSASYYAFDGLGSTVGITSEAGNLQDTYSYSPFGEMQSVGESYPGPFLFSGQYGVVTLGPGMVWDRARVLFNGPRSIYVT